MTWLLGNGESECLAAAFMDSLATTGYPVLEMGLSIMASKQLAAHENEPRLAVPSCHGIRRTG